MPRTICWFSCGAASTLATLLVEDGIPVYCHIENEHPDNWRFMRDCEVKFKRRVTVLKSEKYADCWEVWEKERWLNGPGGARCTTEMKKLVRRAFTLPDDTQVFGFTVEEKDRAERFQEHNPEVIFRFPLIEQGLGKGDCLDWLATLNLTMPMMYRLGYHNANCVGCVKGGKGYWNKIRRDFPATFKRMAELERSIGASCINGTYLDELNPRAGRHKDLELPECGLFCGESA